MAYIPSSPVNLISDSLCAQAGLFFDYKLDAIVDRNEEPLATVQLKAGLRCLLTGGGPPGTESEPTVPQALACAQIISGKRPSLQLWHERLCHAGKGRVLEACSRAGISFSKHEIESFFCEACALGKSKELVSRVTPSKHSQPGVFYADLVDIKPAARGIHKFALHIAEKGTSYHWARGIKSKSAPEVTKALKDFFKLFETQTGLKPRVLHVDAGKEWLNYLVEAEIAAWGIELEVTAPDTPAQNGPAERAGAILVEAMRCMLLGAGLPDDLWMYALQTAVTVINLLPTASNEGQESPHEALARYRYANDHEPYIKHLRTFGCDAYVHRKGVLRPEKGKKMEARAVKGKLIGYDSAHGHIYFVYIPHLDKVVRVRDARFREVMDPSQNDQGALHDADAGEVDYEAVFDDPVLVQTHHAHRDTLVPSTQEEQQQHTLEKVQKRVRFEEELEALPVRGKAPEPIPEPQHRLMTPEGTPEAEEAQEQLLAELDASEQRGQHSADPNASAESPRGPQHPPQHLPQHDSQSDSESESDYYDSLDAEVQKDADVPVASPRATAQPSATSTAAPLAPESFSTTLSAPEALEPAPAAPEASSATEPPSATAPKPRKARTPCAAPPTDRQTREKPRTDYKKLSKGYFNSIVYKELDVTVPEPLLPETLDFSFAALSVRSFLCKGAPKNYKQARDLPDFETVWKPAMQRQLTAIEAHNVWTLVELPEGAVALPGQWVFDTKTNAAGEIIRERAR
ncbi:hypothetical protein IMZ48_12175 [Candidatus Bathyarchaeota archaeon]|nr:hypothetical protein [Candidatus Bathyarchaeota archaeon]